MARGEDEIVRAYVAGLGRATFRYTRDFRAYFLTFVAENRISEDTQIYSTLNDLTGKLCGPLPAVVKVVSSGLKRAS